MSEERKRLQEEAKRRREDERDNKFMEKGSKQFGTENRKV